MGKEERKDAEEEEEEKKEEADNVGVNVEVGAKNNVGFGAKSAKPTLLLKNGSDVTLCQSVDV